MAVICSDVHKQMIDPQVFHNPFNTGVDGYAHAIHNSMHSSRLEDSPATLTVVSGAR
jgi:hypothetical protein